MTDEACKAAKPATAELVGQCPPPAKADAPFDIWGVPVCMKAGAACSLYEQQCCAGLACTPEGETAASCQPASTETLAQLRKCAGAGYADKDTGDVAPTELVTSVGTITLPAVDSVQLQMGPQGCVNRVSMQLENDLVSFVDRCSLKLEARLVGTKMEVTSLTASFLDCPGYEGEGDLFDVFETDSEALAAFEFSYEGVACGDLNHTFDGERYCAQGTYSWRLRGVVGDVDFGDQTLTIKGGFCSSDPLVGACPAWGRD